MNGDEDTFEEAPEGEDIVDRLFDDSEPEDDKETESEVETETEEEVEETEDEGVAEEVEDADPEDYEAPLDKKKPKDEKKEADPEDVPADETVARKMAKENGRKVKELSAELTTLKLERDQERAAREKAERDRDDAKKVYADPLKDPEYRKIHESVMTDVRESAELIDGARNIPANFGGLVTKYLKARNAGDERPAQIDALKAEIIEKCVVKDVPFEDMDDFEKRDAEKTALKVMSLIRKNADPVQQAVDLAQKLKNDAEEGSFVMREREYGESSGRLKPLIEDLGTLADDVIEANPHAVESIVAALIRDNPAAKTRATKLKADLIEVFAGLRPLTKAETDKLKTEGADLKEYESERRKAHDAKVKRFVAYAFHGTMIRSLVGPMAKELATFKGEKDAEESELDTLMNRTKKRGPKKKAPESQKLAKVGTSARAELLGDGWDDDDDD